MKCPSCGRDVVDPEATFCPRCAAPLSGPTADVTERLDVPDPTGTTELQPEGTFDTTSAPPEDPADPRQDAAHGRLRGLLDSWLDAISAACWSFLVLLLVGCVLLLAAKAQYSGFGTGANPLQVLSAIVILALAVLRTPVHVGHLVVTVMPLGAFAAFGIGTIWACRKTWSSDTKSAAAGLKLAPPFALICWVAALGFRFQGKDPVFAGAWGALIWGAVWAALLGVLAAWAPDLPSRLRSLVASGGDRDEIRRGLAMGTATLATAAVLAAAALLMIVIVGLIRGGPSTPRDIGEAVAASVYLIAFLPNLVVAIIAIGSGAPIDVGARVTVAGSVVDRVHHLGWFGDQTGLAVALVVVPLVASGAAAYWLGRADAPREAARSLGIAAATFAVTVSVAAWAGEARIGAGLLGRGLAQVDVHPLWTLVGTFLCAVVGGGLGSSAHHLTRQTARKDER
ncbi:MAG TPA: hypothetical protein VFK89_03160 [Actinomycetota bacterium]|nr:hypothetical protein [Actinomycetota bacterium]